MELRRCTSDELKLLNTAEERELILHIASLTDEIIASVKDYDPARITHYVCELATKFHKFYASCRVKGIDEPLMQARLNLCESTRTVIKNVLDLIKVTAPEKM